MLSSRVSIQELARQEGISDVTLYHWHKQAIARYFERTFVPEDPEEKLPLLIRAQDHSTLALAGVWDQHTTAVGQTEETFAIITVPALPALQHIHERMPLVLDRNHWPLWWHPHARRTHLEPCFQPADFSWESFSVSPQVNSTRYDTPEAVLPWDGTAPD